MIDWKKIVFDAAGYPEIREPEDALPGCLALPECDPDEGDKARDVWIERRMA